MTSIAERVARGQTWRDKRIGRPMFDAFRRIALVERTDERYVYVLGGWQRHTDKGWVDYWPTARNWRHSRVERAGFVRTHELIEDKSVITSRREATDG